MASNYYKVTEPGDEPQQPEQVIEKPANFSQKKPAGEKVKTVIIAACIALVFILLSFGVTMLGNSYSQDAENQRQEAALSRITALEKANEARQDEIRDLRDRIMHLEDRRMDTQRLPGIGVPETAPEPPAAPNAEIGGEMNGN